MPKKAKYLSEWAVASIKQPGRHPVGGVDGLRLLLAPSGGRSWVLRILTGEKRRDVGLGSYPTIKLATKRTNAADQSRKG